MKIQNSILKTQNENKYTNIKASTEMTPVNEVNLLIDFETA